MKEKEVNVLITSAGRRGALVKCFKESIKGIDKVHGEIFAIDVNPLSAALYICDKYYVVPCVSDKNYISTLFKICKKERIKLIIPTIDTELLILSQNKKKFKEIGTIIVVSNPESIKICRDKLKTFKFFVENNIPTVKTFSREQIDEINDLKFPKFIKPCYGSGGKNTFKINNKKELDFYKDYIDNPVIQEFAKGQEFTLDVLADLHAKVVSVVPRERIEIRAGEVNKGKTVKDQRLIKFGKMIVEKLGGIGPITIQCFIKDDEIKFTEINPRFGGGYPLSFAAGANYPELLIRMALGESITARLGEFEENLIMLRWEDAIFIEGNHKKEDRD